MDTFDPYHKWLGIKPKDQPPNHYRLLGVELFEEDPEVIENAADQRMRHVRSLQSGGRVELSQRIVTEIAAAKVCLLDTRKRQEYDRILRSAQAIPEAVVEAPPLRPGPGRPPVTDQRFAAPRPALSPRPRPNRTSALPVLAVTAAGVGILLLLMLMATLFHKKDNSGSTSSPLASANGLPPGEAAHTTPAKAPQRPEPLELKLLPIADIQLDKGQKLIARAKVRDAEQWGDRVSFAAGIGDPAEMQIEPTIGDLRWTPPAIPHRGYLLSVEAHTRSHYDSVTFKVEFPWSRGELTLDDLQNQSIYPDQNVKVNVDARDELGPGKGVRYELVHGPSGSTLHDQLFHWQASSSDVGQSFRVKIRATDERGSTNTKTFTIRVIERPPPEVAPGTTGDKRRSSDAPPSGPRRGFETPPLPFPRPVPRTPNNSP